MRSKLFVVASLLLMTAPVGAHASSSYDYSWALPEWRATWSAPRLADNRGFAVRADDDAVYVGGVTASHGQGAGDLFVLRYDRKGNLIWARNWGGFQLDQAQGLSLDATSVWAAGSFTSDDGVVQFALVRYSKNGDLLMQKTWARGVASYVQGIAVDGDAVYVAGLTKPTTGNSDFYVARLSTDGTIVWERTFGGSGFDEAWDIALRGDVVYASGFTSPGASEQATLIRLDRDGNTLGETRWGVSGNVEARAIAFADDGIYYTGSQTFGEATDLVIGKLTFEGKLLWTKTTAGQVVGGGGYAIGIGERGVYVVGGTYDFPAGGDGAIFRFSRDGVLEWSQYYGLPGFWDWGFDVDVRAGHFFVAGVLYTPGPDWYSVVSMEYREDFPTVSLTGVAARAMDGDSPGAQAALAEMWPADFLRWARGPGLSHDNASNVHWEGASDSGRRYGKIWLDNQKDPAAGESNAADAFTGLQYDMASQNFSLVRDWTAVSGSLLDGLIRFRYCISHDRLIPQGGYIAIGDASLPLPPPPV